MILPVTLTIAAAAGIGNLILAARIVGRRFRDKVMIGDGGDARLLARTRAQANFVEYAPFVLILTGLIEAGGGSPRGLGIVGGIFVAARIAHAIGMDRPAPNPWRAGGALLTWGVLLALSLWGAVLVYGYDTAVPMEIVPVDGAATI